MPKTSLEETVKLAKKGDADAIATLFATCLPTIRREASRAVYPGLDFEDAVQEGMIGLYKAVQTYKPEEEASFKTYATVCIHNAVASAGKIARAKKHGPLNSSRPITDEPSTYGPEDIAIQKEQYQNALKRIATKLSSFEQQVLKLYLEGKPYSEIAEICGTTQKAVDNAMQRLRRKLK